MNQSPIIAEAFSRTAEKYDSFAEDHPHLTRMREKTYAHLSHHLPSNSHILELNAGTGTDAVALAKRGYYVHATDIASGMFTRLKDKVKALDLEERVTFQESSYTDLGAIQNAPFDAVFSNMGGLNCIPDLSPVIAQLPALLKPNGIVCWVLMPPVCLWELAEVFRGNFRVAFRRFAKNGTRTHLEGLYFNTYYFKPKKIIQSFGADYSMLDLEGLSVMTPTAESKNLVVKYPRLYRALTWLDDRLAFLPPWRGWGDFYILTMRLNRYNPAL